MWPSRASLGIAAVAAGMIALAAPCQAKNELAELGVSDAEAKLAFDRGVISGQAEACGLDWRQLNFKPMMAYWRRIGKNGQQTAILATMHGAGQGSAEKTTCTPALREKLKFDR